MLVFERRTAALGFGAERGSVLLGAAPEWTGTVAGGADTVAGGAEEFAGGVLAVPPPHPQASSSAPHADQMANRFIAQLRGKLRIPHRGDR